MKKTAIAALLLVLMTVPAAQFPFGSSQAFAARKTPKDCSLTLYASLPMEVQPDGRFSIPITMDNHALNFLVDTGGAVATITEYKALYMRKEIKETRARLTGVAGVTMNRFVVADTFSLGPLTGKKLELFVEERPIANVDGTLAPDMLQQYDIDFDFAGKKMNIFSQDHCKGKVVHWTNSGHVVLPITVTNINGHIRIPVFLEGKKVWAILDSGAAGSLMPVRVAKALGIEPGHPDLKPEGIAAGHQVYSYPFKMLDFDGVAVTNPKIAVVADDFLKGLNVDLIIGIGIMSKLRLYVAYEEEKLYITPANAN